MEATAEEARTAAFVDGTKDIAFGSVAGMVSKVFEHPFDLCKVRLQSQVLDKIARFSGPIDCLKSTWKSEGIRGLYRGLPAPVVGAMAENATLFLSYGQLQRLVRAATGTSSPTGELSAAQKAVAAAGAGSITSFLLTPIELVKCKMQVQMLAAVSSAPEVVLKEAGLALSTASASASASAPGPVTFAQGGKPNFSTLPGPMSILKSVVRTHGWSGLWLGQTGTLIRETGGAVAWFGTKEGVCSLLLHQRQSSMHHFTGSEDEMKPTSKDLRAWESALAGACAGVSYNVVLFPADSVKSALQTAEELRGSRTGLTYWGVARDMWAKQGVKGMYAGMGVTTARAIPSSAMIFLIYDGLSKRFG